MNDSWAIDPADADAALVTLRGAKTVLMPTHQNVDADGLSSPLAMRLALAEYGVDAYPLISDGDFPSNLRFLPGVESVLVYGRDELPDYDMLCLIDCADRRRLGNFAKDDPYPPRWQRPDRQHRPPHHQRPLRGGQHRRAGGVVLGGDRRRDP